MSATPHTRTSDVTNTADTTPRAGPSLRQQSRNDKQKNKNKAPHNEQAYTVHRGPSARQPVHDSWDAMHHHSKVVDEQDIKERMEELIIETRNIEHEMNASLQNLLSEKNAALDFLQVDNEAWLIYHMQCTEKQTEAETYFPRQDVSFNNIMRTRLAELDKLQQQHKTIYTDAFLRATTAAEEAAAGKRA